VTRKKQKLTPKQRVLKRFPAAYLHQPNDPGSTGEWPYMIHYRHPTRLTTGVLAGGPTPQTAWDEAARVMAGKRYRRA
jgi:hypothetical protein